MIQIADRIYRLRTHQKYLVERSQQLVDEFKNGTGDAESIAKTMVCGTIIGGKNVRQIHERLNYCRVNKHCKACRAARFSDCACKIIDRLPGEKSACCIPCVIPFPQHYDYHETLDTARAALGLVKTIANMFCRWNQSAQHGRPDRILEYAIGLHLRFVESQQQLWPHVHVLLIAENGLQLESKNGRSLKESMEKCLRVATPEMAPLLFRFGEFDRFFVDSAGDVRSLQYGRRIARKDLERRMKYAMSMEEVGEETEGNGAGGYSSIADTMRHKMLADLGYPTTFTHSRTKKKDSAKVPSPTSQPCDFDPLPLRKESVLQFDVLTHELTHAWGRRTASILRSVLAKSTDERTEKESQIVRQNVTRFASGIGILPVESQTSGWKPKPQSVARVEQCVRFVLGDEDGVTLNRLAAYRDAKSNFDRGAVLPPETMEGLRSRYHRHRTNAEVLELTKSQLTTGQKIAVQRKAEQSGVEVEFDPAKYDAVRLYVYAFEMGMTDEIRQALRDKAEAAAARLPVQFERVGADAPPTVDSTNRNSPCPDRYPI